jgi:apolipoprotein N-acyltransferase
LFGGHDKLPTPLPSDAKHQPDGENPMTLKALQKNIKTKENKNQEQRQYNLNTYTTSKNHRLVVLDNTLYPTAPI